MTAVLLHTVSTKTDAFAGMSSGGVTYGSATLRWTNASKSQAKFQVVDDDGRTFADTTVVDGEQEGEVVVKSSGGLDAKKFYLERLEVGEWVRQTSTSSLDYVLVSTPKVSLSVATGSTSAKVSWPSRVLNSKYLVYYDVQEEEITPNSPSAQANVKGGTGQALLSGLVQGKSYNVMLGAEEDGQVVALARASFTTSVAAQMVITGPFASYMGIDWSDSVDGSGPNGSQYRIVHRDSGSDYVLAESSTETKATIQDLLPGSEYNIVLQRQELGGNWSDQNEVVANTVSASLSLSSVASKTIAVTWPKLYEGAQFEVFYTAPGGTPVGNGRTAAHAASRENELSSTLRNLKPGTSYSIDLVIYELEQAVGLAKLGLTTKEGIGAKSMIGIVAVILLILGFLLLNK